MNTTPTTTPKTSRAPLAVLGAAVIFGLLTAASYTCNAATRSNAPTAQVAVDCDPVVRPIIL